MIPERMPSSCPLSPRKAPLSCLLDNYSGHNSSCRSGQADPPRRAGHSRRLIRRQSPPVSELRPLAAAAHNAALSGALRSYVHKYPANISRIADNLSIHGPVSMCPMYLECCTEVFRGHHLQSSSCMLLQCPRCGSYTSDQ